MFDCRNFSFECRSQIKQTLKKKAFEEAGIPVKQISLVQVQPSTIAPTQVTQMTQETVYIKSEPQIMSFPSTSTTTIILPATSEPPHELIVSDEIKSDLDDQMDTHLTTQIGTHDELNILTNPDDTLLSSLTTPTTEGDDSIEIKMEEVPSG